MDKMEPKGIVTEPEQTMLACLPSKQYQTVLLSLRSKVNLPVEVDRTGVGSDKDEEDRGPTE